jgi:hypothetical protein
MANKAAKKSVRVMQSNHYIKQAAIAVYTLFMAIMIAQLQKVAQVAQEANKTAHNNQKRLENLMDPTYGEIIGTAVGATIDGMIGAYYWLKNSTMHTQ